MTHVMAPDERRRRLDSGADLHVSERYDGAQRMNRHRSVNVRPSVCLSVCDVFAAWRNDLQRVSKKPDRYE